jgi:hypothetical protein
MNNSQIRRWRNPISFVKEVLRDPDNDGLPFQLYPEEEAFLREALTLTLLGRLRYPELLYSAPKKSGKTALAAICMLYAIIVLGGRYAEGYCVANDLDQSTGRVFKACVRIIEASPLLKGSASTTQTRITFTATQSTIEAIASDYAGAAGSNPTFICFDELWAYVSEGARRLWDEMVPVPTRKVSARLTVTYAGFEGESILLEELYKHGLSGKEIAPALYRQDGMLMFWTHTPPAPWQTAEWVEQMRQQLRKNAFLRMIENRFVSAESDFVEMAWWDACVDPTVRPVVSDPRLSAWLGVDVGVKKDSTAVVGCTFDSESKKVRLIYHRIFQPTKETPLDFEATIESTLLELRSRFHIREVRYDPWQMISSAQRLSTSGLPMVEFPQTVPNLTEASQNLYDLIKGRNLAAYEDAEIRTAISRAAAKETPRGWRIGKEKQTHKVDVVVALAQAALGAVRGGAQPVSSFAKDALFVVGQPIPREFRVPTVDWKTKEF